MLTISLPRLVGSEVAADKFVDALLEDGSGPLAGENICIEANQLASGSETFAQRLMTRLGYEEKVGKILVRGASGEFREFLARGARRHGLEYRVHFMNAQGWITQTHLLQVECICEKIDCICGSATRRAYIEERDKTEGWKHA